MRNTIVNRTASSRRGFFKLAGAAFAAPYILPSISRAAVPPSNRINIACIGTGRMGTGDLMETIGHPQAQIVAVCDVDSNRAQDAKQKVEQYYARNRASGDFKGCTAYGDFREVLTRPDIDAVQIATPDQWHAFCAIAAARAGKDVFIQKPMTLTIEEGRLLSDTVRKHGRILQVGSQQRSDTRFRFACELVRNGRLGKIHTIQVGLPIDPAGPLYPAMPVPPNLDYEMWLGPAPYAPYTEERVHPQKGYDRPGWLRVEDYCLGMITGWGAHHLDIVQWAMNTEHAGPVSITATAEYPKDGVWDVHGAYHIEYTYANGVKVICSDKNPNGVKFEGSDGWVFVTRGAIDAGPKSLLTTIIGPSETHLYESRSHKGNFLQCIQSRQETICPVEVGHRSNTVCCLGYIAMKLARPLKWDPNSEQFPKDPEANRFLRRPQRAPWRL